MTPDLRAVICAVVFAATLLALLPAQAQSPQETLTQYISDLQKNPNDYALREKIIKHVQTMTPAPSIPEEAKKRLNRGMAAAESAKNEDDYKGAIDEFQKAVNIAPWLGIGYRNLAVVQDKAGQYSAALQNLKLFLLTNPSSTDAEAAKTLIDKIEYRKEKAAKESSPKAVAEREKNREQDLIKRLDGARYVGQSRIARMAWDDELVVRGTTLVWRKRIAWVSSNVVLEEGYSVGTWLPSRQTQIVGREARFCRVPCKPEDIVTISEDGNSIVIVELGIGTFTCYRQ